MESGDSERWAALPGAAGSSSSDEEAGALSAPLPRRHGAVGSVSAAAPNDSSAGADGTLAGAAITPLGPDALAVRLGSLSLTIAHDPAAGLAHRVWPSSLALAAAALREGGGGALAATYAVELGCGPGLAGAAWAAAGARVVLTDLEPCLPLARRSIQLCGGLGGRAAVARLGWGERGGLAAAAAAGAEAGWWAAATAAPPAPDLVLAADVVYDPALFQPLLSTLAEFGAAGTRRVLLAHVRRWKTDARFWRGARKAWTVRDVTPLGEGGGGGRRTSSHERGAQRLFELVWKGGVAL